jgi:uncharacterized protein YllA (UPF0747 family)
MSETLWILRGKEEGKAPEGWLEGSKDEAGRGPARGGEGRPPADGAFHRDLAELNERLGARPEALDLLEKVLRGEADVIITGQQPGLLGGPVYNYLKLATAMILARRWTALSGRPVLPLFWGVTDDTDYGEVSWTLFPDRELNLRKVRPRLEPPNTRTMVGSLPREFWHDARSQIMETLPAADASVSGSELLDDVGSLPGEDWGEMFLALLLKSSGKQPLIVVDGRRPALLEAAEPLFHGYFDRRDAVVKAWASRPGSTVGEPALSEESVRGALFAVRGDERHPFDGQEGLRSPNVVLRPLVQGYLFPQRAVVVGLGEIRYRLELRGVYDVLDLTPPPLIPRFSATVLPPAASKLPADMDPTEWLFDPAKARSRLERSRREEDLSRLLEELQAALRAALHALSEIGAEEDRSYPQMVSSGERKIIFQIRRLEEGLRGKIRSRWFKEIPGLARMEEFLRPRGQLQERGLNMLALGHLYGTSAYSELNRWVEQWVEQWLGSGEDSPGRPVGIWDTWILGPTPRERPFGRASFADGDGQEEDRP